MIPCDYPPAIMVTGPKDGELIAWPHSSYQLAKVADINTQFSPEEMELPLDMEILTYRRVTFVTPGGKQSADFFVPDEWPPDCKDLLFDYFICRAANLTPPASLRRTRP